MRLWSIWIHLCIFGQYGLKTTNVKLTTKTPYNATRRHRRRKISLLSIYLFRSRHHGIIHSVSLPSFSSKPPSSQVPTLSVPSASTLRIQNQRNDQPIETQDLAENQNQHHPDEDPRLQHVAPHAHIAHDTNRIAGSEPREADAEAGGQVQEAREEGVVLAGRGCHVARNEDGDDEGVDGDDAGHDDGDERL